MVRVRRDVWRLPEGDETLRWYGLAVEAMMDREDEDPTSWVYMACIHGVPARQVVPRSGRGIWDQCRHASWFFLPWHRAYLASFEAVVSATVEQLGGPEWSLPYWNYADPLAAGEERRLLPEAFRLARRPDGSSNPLFAPRAADDAGDAGLSDDNIVSLECLGVLTFATGAAATPDGFGGSDETDPSMAGTGELEAVPHNAVHRRLGGGGGWMGSTTTAALDPIFWLHHCFIDRVWEVWRNGSGVSGSPAASRWRNQKSPFPDATGAIVRLAPSDVLDTTTLMHGYRYDDVAPATEPPGGGARLMAGRVNREGRMRGGNDGPVPLGSGETSTVVRMDAPRGLSAFALREPRRALLGVENVTGAGITPDYEVFVERTDGSDAVRVGRLTTFGLTRASSPADRHGGGGLSKTFDVTAALAELGLGVVGMGEFSVRFVAQPLPDARGEPPARLARFAPPRAEGTVTVGRVNLYRSAPTPLDDID